jgi:hypothetical protein
MRTAAAICAQMSNFVQRHVEQQLARRELIPAAGDDNGAWLIQVICRQRWQILPNPLPTVLRVGKERVNVVRLNGWPFILGQGGIRGLTSPSPG